MAISVDSTQKHFRFRNDDGSETTATWSFSLDTNNSSQSQDVNFRLRYAIEIIAAGSTWTSTDILKMQYNKNSAGWNDITSTSSVIRLSTSGSVSDETATTQQISSPDTFLANNVLTTSTTSTNTVGTGGKTLEIEICAKVRSADTSNGDTIQFRVVTSGGFTVTTTSVTAQLTVTATAGTRKVMVIA